MRLRYTKRALRQIDRALDYIASQSPQGAADVRARVFAAITLLKQHPYSGLLTSRPRVRRILIIPYPYFIEYRCSDTEIVILVLRHTSRKPSR